MQRQLCASACEQRGARLVHEAVTLEPRVLAAFTFVSHQFGNRDRISGSDRTVSFTSSPSKTVVGMSTMRLTFAWSDYEDFHPIDIVPSEFAETALYLADGKEARDVLAQIRRFKDEEDAGASLTAHSLSEFIATLTELENAYERNRMPTTAGRITQQLSEAQDVADEKDFIATHNDDVAYARNKRDHKADIERVFLRVTGRRLHNLPDAAPVTFAVPWVTRVIASLFRDGSAAGWKLDANTVELPPNDEQRFTLSTVAPLADVVWIFARLLSEPAAMFDSLDIPALVRRPLSPNMKAAHLLLRRGIRVWRNVDLVANTFAVDDPVFRALYPHNGQDTENENENGTASNEEGGEEENDEEENREGKEEKKTPPPPPKSKPETREERHLREEAQRVQDDRNVYMQRSLDRDVLPARTLTTSPPRTGLRSASR